MSTVIEARMARAQARAAEAGAAHGAGGEVLDEDVRLRSRTLQQRLVVGRLDVEAQALLAAVQPDEIGGQAVAGRVVAAREVALGALQLDDARPRIGQLGGAGGAATACSIETTSRPASGRLPLPLGVIPARSARCG
jgi:hypothetical protein